MSEVKILIQYFAQGTTHSTFIKLQVNLHMPVKFAQDSTHSISIKLQFKSEVQIAAPAATATAWSTGGSPQAPTLPRARCAELMPAAPMEIQLLMLR